MMIRINLIGEKKAAKKKKTGGGGGGGGLKLEGMGSGSNALLVGILVIGVAAAGFWWWTLNKDLQNWKQQDCSS